MALISSGSAGATPQPGPTSQKGDPVGLKEYEVVLNGQPTTLQLSDEDAKLYGLAGAKPEPKEAAAPANKGGKQPSNKQADAAAQAFGGKGDSA